MEVQPSAVLVHCEREKGSGPFLGERRFFTRLRNSDHRVFVILNAMPVVVRKVHREFYIVYRRTQETRPAYINTVRMH